jgi:7-keto-8-aminopelargonate synthetase-like enzyme
MNKSLEIATRDSSLRDKMWENVRHLRKNLETLNLDLGESASQIIPIIIGSNGEQLILMWRSLP